MEGPPRRARDIFAMLRTDNIRRKFQKRRFATLVPGGQGTSRCAYPWRCHRRLSLSLASPIYAAHIHMTRQQTPPSLKSPCLSNSRFHTETTAMGKRKLGLSGWDGMAARYGFESFDPFGGDGFSRSEFAEKSAAATRREEQAKRAFDSVSTDRPTVRSSSPSSLHPLQTNENRASI